MIAPSKLRSGARIDLVNPDPALIRIEDIAIGLAGLRRFNNAAPRPISVAEHSLDVARRVPLVLHLAALLHDAKEYLIGDTTRPVMAALAYIAEDDAMWRCFAALERRVDQAIVRAVIAEAGLAGPCAPIAENRLIVQIYGQEVRAADDMQNAAELDAAWHPASPRAIDEGAVAARWLSEVRDAAWAFCAAFEEGGA